MTLWFRRRDSPPLDVGLAAERTAMSWQRTALTLAAFSALLVHVAERRVALAGPGLAGLLLAVMLLVAGERRYSWTLRRVQTGQAPVAPRLVLVLTGGVQLLALSALVLMAYLVTTDG